jgi:GNAT superfamily N-acetyltransferase
VVEPEAVSLTFKPFGDFQPGTVFSLLSRSYSQPNALGPALLREWKRDWREYDEDVYRHPDTVGQSGFVSCLADGIVGLGSWDPRPFPTARIGHNCIVPEFRKNGYGALQLKHITALLRGMSFTRAVAETGDTPFFEPARRMYESCRFLRVAAHPPGSHAPFAVAEYHLVL